ncbi:hypothetical protein DFJ77DRAFT_511933 [Powellomyces hirtus]|nr:hypothetical protein DFJ77DRAFT_511933 [Powellomyces hirtus]
MYTLDTLDIAAFYTLPDGHPLIAEKKSIYGKRKRAVTNLSKYKAKGAFAHKENVTDISKMKTIVFSCHNLEVDNSEAQAIGTVRLFLKEIGHVPLDMTKEEHLHLLKRYDEAIQILKQPYNQQVEAGEGEVFEYAPEVAKISQRLEDSSSIYDMDYPSNQKILDRQDDVIAATQFLMPHSRSNMATLVNAFHPDADKEKDNLFFPAGKTGTSVIIWNKRKVDRIKKGKQRADEVEDLIDNTRYIQPLNTVLPIPFMEPERVGQLLSKFVNKYRSKKEKSKYIFLNRDGKPLMNNATDDKRFEPYRNRVKIATGHNISVIRRSQITRVRDMGLTKQEHTQFAADCHHSKEENNRYWRDYVFRDSTQSSWRRR